MLKTNKTAEIVTLGCRVNQYESVAIAEALQDNGITVKKDSGVCDYYIVNTCSVTAESQRQSRQIVRRCAAKGKTAVIGCASQNIASDFLKIPNVFYVGGCKDKMKVVSAILSESLTQADFSMDNVLYEEMNVVGNSSLFSTCRAFVKIQDGCNGRCSYCVIPSLRGKSRSRKPEEIYREVLNLIHAGYREVILTGIETSAYNAAPIPELITHLGTYKSMGLERVRLGSLSPQTLNENFLAAAAASPNFMPHVHLSLQSGSERILRLMKRTYTAENALKRIELLKNYLPAVQISADFITGFPTESEEDYLATEEFVKKTGMMHVHAFPYSEREGTPAAQMEGSIPKTVRKERCLRLNKLSQDMKKQILSCYLEKTVSVLVEKIDQGIAVGHTEEYLDCAFPAGDVQVGDIVNVRTEKVQDTLLIGGLF